MTTHRAGPADRVWVTADRRVPLSLPHAIRGPGFAVHPEPTAAGLVGHVSGSAEPEQVLRLLDSHGVLGEIAAGAEETVDVRVEAARADDQATYAADRRLSHRYVLHRRYHGGDRADGGPRVVWFGFNPIRGDLHGPPDEMPRRPSLRNVVAIARNGLGRLGTLTVLNLFTRRSPASGDIAADPDGSPQPRALLGGALEEADGVLAAWGSAAGPAHLDRIRRVWEAVEGAGHRLAAPAVDGRVRLTVRWPRQPCHPSRKATDGVGLAPLPVEWIETFDAAGAVDCSGRRR